MKFRLLINIARSLLLARWKQTLVAAIGVTFSITMFVTLLSFMNGLNDLLDGLILNRTPHVKLYNEIKPTEVQPIDLDPSFSKSYNFIRSVKPGKTTKEIRNYLAVTNSLEKDGRVLGYAPKIVAQVFFNVGATDLTGVINGIDPDEENRLFKFKEYVVKGNYLDLKNIPNSIILGKALAETMMVEVGDLVQITTSQGEQVQLKVVGLFQSGIQELDKVQSYASIGTVQKILGKSTSYVTDIQIKLKDMSLAPALEK
jgi:lipoprotein-releasing system permease protein